MVMAIQNIVKYIIFTETNNFQYYFNSIWKWTQTFPSRSLNLHETDKNRRHTESTLFLVPNSDPDLLDTEKFSLSV